MEETYIRHWDNAMSEYDCDRIIAKFESMSDVSYLSGDYIDGSKQFGNKLIRKDYSLFFEQLCGKEAQEIQAVVGEKMTEYREEFVGLQNMGGLVSYTCKVQKTPPKGGFHTWHCEHGTTISSYRRVAVWLLYLTTHEGSGDTEFLQQGLKFEPKKGTLVIWPAGFTHPHRGNPVYDKDKYIATGWFEFYDQPFVE